MSAKSKSIRGSRRAAGSESRRRARKGYKFRVSIHSAAELLDCDASHLRRVLTGDRKSPELLARYNALKVA